MTDPKPPLATTQSITVLRSHLRTAVELEDEASLVGFAEKLGSDARRGVQGLVRSATTRVAAMRSERERVAKMFELRSSLYVRGFKAIAGVDEVGVGPLAGPVVAAAVILPEEVNLPLVNDSKKLKPAQREKLSFAIHEQAIAVSIGSVSPEEIDSRNIFQASLEAMRRAVEGLNPAPDYCLVDARTIPRVTVPQQGLIHGDAIDASIASASIVAKVFRDRLMQDFDVQYPGYGFGRHMGYGTAQHLEALERLGASPIHRRSFGPVAAVMRGTARVR
ncbi:MAG: ribonuclease HII [Myxococcota bacterium]